MLKTLLAKYYSDNQPLAELLYKHSQQVADLAMQLAKQHSELQIDLQFLEEAALLHDIGIVCCDAPRILCKGQYPYLMHGFLGAEILRHEGLPRHARVAERHTGAGLLAEDIERLNTELLEKIEGKGASNLTLSAVPVQDYLPETIEEKLICYADKFYSKSHIGQQYTYEQARIKLQCFGQDTTTRFDAWHKMFQ